MSKQTDRPPKIYDAVAIPSNGRLCKRYVNDDGEIRPCTNDAEYVFVYERNANNDLRANCVACAECTPEVTP